MDMWPAVTSIVLFIFCTDKLTLARSRQFTVNDIVYLHPSTTPFPGGFKCFTCENVFDNYECNRWAPDVYCPRESRFCYTRHHMDLLGESMSVTKRCAGLNDCLNTGCNTEGENLVCTSCCEGNICNLPLPWNETDAVFATVTPLSGAASWGISSSPTVITIITIFTIITCHPGHS